MLLFSVSLFFPAWNIEFTRINNSYMVLHVAPLPAALYLLPSIPNTSWYALVVIPDTSPDWTTESKHRHGIVHSYINIPWQWWYKFLWQILLCLKYNNSNIEESKRRTLGRIISSCIMQKIARTPWMSPPHYSFICLVVHRHIISLLALDDSGRQRN